MFSELELLRSLPQETLRHRSQLLVKLPIHPVSHVLAGRISFTPGTFRPYVGTHQVSFYRVSMIVVQGQLQLPFGIASNRAGLQFLEFRL